MSLYRLVYYSHNLVAYDASAFANEVDDILFKSKRNNDRDDITGALMFNGGCFAQVLEGPLGSIEAAFERVQQDERHGEVSLLSLDPVESRSFPNWAMGFVGLFDENAVRFAGVGAASGFDPSILDGNELHRVLRDLAFEEERSAIY